MVTIINAVECMSDETLNGVVDLYVNKHESGYTVFTDDKNVYNYVCSKYGKDKCVYQENIITLWLKATYEAIFILTDIANICSTVYEDIVESYSAICIGQN